MIMFATSDDHAILKQVEATHVPDGRPFAVKPLLHIIEDIFQHAAPSVPGFVQQGSTQAQLDLIDDKAHQSGFFDMLDQLSFHKVSSEISCKCSGGGDAHATTLGIFNTLASYSWDAKLVLAMAAFALNYGEFWFVAQLYPTNPLAKSVALLKQLPEILERADTLKTKFEALRNLIKAMLDVTKCIIEFKELPAHYITPDTPEMVTATAHIPTAVYWTIRSIVACSAQIMGLVGMGHEYIVSTAESWELTSLAHKVNTIHTHLKNQLNLCFKIIDEKRHIESYQALVRLMETSHIDNMNVLRALIYEKDDQLPLIEGSTERRAGLELLRRKNVLLLISDLDVSHDELFILEQMYHESRQHPTRTESQYEVVWMPVLDRTAPWTEEKQQRFETLKRTMPWYSIHHPSMVDPAVIRYVMEFWHFKKKPILVVLDPQGRVVNTNALHMMWIWGIGAFPFTSAREEALWRDEIWRLELLADSIDASIPDWIVKKRLVCLYGGEDIEWIRKFTAAAQAVARVSGITLEMLYVGKGNPKEKVRKNISTIESENLSRTLQDIRFIWFFWVRLESMCQSKMKQGNSAENDPILQEIVTMLSFDGSEHCWAVFCLGAENEMAKAKGDTIMKCLTEFDVWKENAEGANFLPALIQRLKEIQSPDHCNRLILPGITGTIPERVVCSETTDEKRHIESYQALVRLMETSHIDNMNVLRALIYEKDDQLPLIEGSTERGAGLELLRRKNVLLLISDLDVSHDELFILEQMYHESRQHPTRTESQYEVVWMPVLDRTAPWIEEKQQRFETLKRTMPWYSIHHPSMVDPAVLRYVKEFWHFKKKPILVVLDLQGRVVNTNALYMMWIWGSFAFPFTSSREEALWREESWRLELLAENVDTAIPTWMSEGKYICLYGGEDIEWIRKFILTAQAMAKAAGIPWEMLYVGKSNPKEKVRRNMATIVVENLSHTLQDIPLIWFFWVRLESMWHSKMKHGKSAENDPIMQEIVTMLSFDGSDQGWAVICKGSEMAKAKGDTILKCFGDYELWKSNAKQKGPIPAINDYLREIYSPHHCNRLILPGTTGSIPERIFCAECGQPMEKIIMYHCCDE